MKKDILKKYKNWRAIVIGDEPRMTLNFKHKRLNNLGFQNHNKVLKIFEKTSIAVACSRWNEPLGRSSLEASSRGCATIISNRGGLPETVTHGIILKKLNPLQRITIPHLNHSFSMKRWYSGTKVWESN